MKENKVLKWVVGFSSVAMFTGFIGLTQKLDVTDGQQVSLNNSNQQGKQSDSSEQNPFVNENPSWGEGYNGDDGNTNQGERFQDNDANSQENPGWGGDFENGSDQSEGGNSSDSNQNQFGTNGGGFSDSNRVNGRAS
jgi:hypothetical protein